jgi:aarF domain-containing kinase
MKVPHAFARRYSSSKILSESPAVSSLHALVLAVGTRHLHHHYHRFVATSLSSSSSSSASLLFRWEGNRSRLYARHVLLIAAASAATSRLLAELEETIEKPPDWKNWERKDWTDDLMRSIGSTKLQRTLAAMARLVSLGLLWSPMVVMYPLSLVSETFESYSWKFALWAIEQSGPFALKLTQWATTRQDLFSPEFCQYFGKLRDETRGHSWQHTQRIMAEELGELSSWLELENSPIGSGCIAQVYRGKLVKSVNQYPKGTEVAVKVQHPGIWQKVCIDFYILGKAAAFLEAIPGLNLTYLSLVDTVRQFRDIMLPQLDLTLEANHLQRFNRDFANDDRVGFPEPLHGLTTVRILTETFVRGAPIMEYVNREESVRKELANLGLNTTLKMIFLNDLLHGDLHPGNILVSEDEAGRIKLHLLDCGLVVEMGPEQHVNLVKILGAFTRKNGRLAGQLMVDTSSNCQAGELDVELFVRGVERIVVADEDNNFIEKVGEYIADFCYLACKHKVRPRLVVGGHLPPLWPLSHTHLVLCSPVYIIRH